MPIYEYECSKCGKAHELWESIQKNAESTCPDCSGKLNKLISRSTFRLKGGGWYADGYSKKADKSAH